VNKILIPQESSQQPSSTETGLLEESTSGSKGEAAHVGTHDYMSHKYSITMSFL
jgi:hypothetical protein